MASKIRKEQLLPAKSGDPASLDFFEDTDNGTNKITITAPSAIASDKVLTLPDVTGTLALLETVYPVGSVYTNKTVSTNPATLFGFGTWTAIAGRVVVGLDAGQTEFDTAGETGGEKTHLLTGAESGTSVHQHAHFNGSSNRMRGIDVDSLGGVANTAAGAYSNVDSVTTANTAAANASSAHNNLQPYVVCYVWERTA